MWNPQYTGVVPGFVVEVKNNAPVNKNIRIWNTTILIVFKRFVLLSKIKIKYN